MISWAMRETVRPTSAADINSRSVSEESVVPKGPDLLLRLSGRIVKGRRTAGQLSRPAPASLRTVPRASAGCPAKRYPRRNVPLKITGGFQVAGPGGPFLPDPNFDCAPPDCKFIAGIRPYR